MSRIQSRPQEGGHAMRRAMFPSKEDGASSQQGGEGNDAILSLWKIQPKQGEGQTGLVMR